MLELRPNCECCDRDLPPSSSEARVCSFECTFCATCTAAFAGRNCPNCGGNLTPRPIRPENLLAQHPASMKRIFNAKCREQAESEMGGILVHFAGAIETPIGRMTAIVNNDGALVRLDFVGDSRAEADWQPSHGVVRDDDAVVHVNAQIKAYFCRELEVFNLPLAPVGNRFLREAWSHLAQVPYGTTITYGELAQRLDKPTSARAIGRANAINPISIVVPCHRIIGANGKLTGYSGGLERKAALLRLEGVNAGCLGHEPARFL